MFVRIAGGMAAALCIAALMASPTIFGVATWKWLLGAIGAAIFVTAGRRRR
jgi:hypothetical protein